MQALRLLGNDTAKIKKSRRVKPALIPTPLSLGMQRPVVIRAIAPVVGKQRNRQVFRRLGGYVLWFSKEAKKPSFDAAAAGQKLRELLENLGGIWIKVGQLASLRNDGFPPEFCSELSKLQHRAIGFPPDVARRTIEQELGRPIEEVFTAFEDMPVAAASVSQVHRAVLRTGGVVAVKVQRPDVEATFDADMAVLQRAIGWLDRLNIMRPMRWHEALSELRQVLREEVDFRYEADNARRLRKSLKRHRVYVPYVYQKLSGKRVLVMEFLAGVLMSDVIEARRFAPDIARNWMYQNRIEPKKVGRRLYQSAMRQLLEDNLFHADLHPGNIMLLRNSRVALIDLGTIGELDLEFLQTYRLSLKAMACGDWAQAVDLNLHLCPELPSIGIDRLRRDLVTVYRNWVAKARLPNVPYAEKSLAAAGRESSRLMYSYGVAASWSFLRVSRTWSTLDASLNELIPDVSYVDLFTHYFEDAQRRENDPKEVAKAVTVAASAARDVALTNQVWQASLGRRQVLALSGAGTKSQRFAGSLMGLLSFLLTMAGLLSLVGLITDAVDRVRPGAAVKEIPMLADLPNLFYGWWFVLLTLFLTMAIWAGRMKRNFEASSLNE